MLEIWIDQACALLGWSVDIFYRGSPWLNREIHGHTKVRHGKWWTIDGNCGDIDLGYDLAETISNDRSWRQVKF